MAMQKRVWMVSFLFKEFLAIFKKYVPSGMSFINQHLLVLDGHGNHVTFKNNKTSTRVWVRHKYITISYITCSITIRCVLFQAI
jgi:hypothetical protein